ncbi:MAG: hypothetical protein KKB25_02910, partial [Nanoarchaeota archaeon]|nr:hypothetical protein [Nanoarchaeota archaeon]
MKKILLILAVFAAFSIASQSAAAGGWWNESWHFRVPVNISFSAITQNASVNASVNFSAALSALGASGAFDKNSLRVVENNSDIPADFFNTTLTAGNVSWIANGTTAANANRTFYIYFDILENGAKAAGKLISESCNGYGNNTCYWRSDYNNSMDVWSNQTASPGVGYEWNRSWAQSIEVNWKWSTEPNYDFSYLYLNGAFYSQKTGSGSETVQIAASRITARFTSDSSTINSAIDSYGTYGTAVDTIKFYPTANITTGAFTASQAAAQKQYPPNLLSVSVSGAGWGETFNYTLNASDPERDNVSVTLFTYQNGRWNRNAALIGNNTILNWTISPFSCSVSYSDIGVQNYMFEYNDSSHAPVNSSNYSQTLEKDDIALEYYSGNASVNREGSGNITFGIKLNDTDRRAYVSGASVNFWAYYSGAWNSAGANTTITGGAGIYSFGPNCSQSAGGNIWKANYSGTCYKTGESANIIYTAIGQIKNYLIQPPPLSYDLGTSVPIEANITDECANPISGASVNFSVNATNYTAVDWGGGKYNYSWDSSGKATGNYTIQINASKLFYLFNLTSWFNAFTVAAGPPQINISLNASQAAQNSIVEINASIADMGGSGINWVRANITYPNSTTAQYNMTNLSSSVWQTVLNDTLRRGQYNITIYASDNFGNTGNSTNSTKVYARLNVVMNSQDYALTRDWFGSVYFKASDANASLQGVNVTLTVQRPDGAELSWLSGIGSYLTNAYGLLNTPTFVMPAGIPLGSYMITAVSAFNDTLAGVVANNTTSYNFTLSNYTQSSASSSAITAKIAVPSVQYVEHDLSLAALFYNSSGMMDADNITITIYQLTYQYNSTQWLSKTKSDLNRLSAGIYTYSQIIPAGTSTGNYLAVLNASKDGISLSDVYSFEILMGGPFDVDVTPLQAEVSQGET